MTASKHIYEMHGMYKTSEYRIYRSAKQRCGNPHNPNYKDYGGRGIEFRFKSFGEFLNELGPRPSLRHSVNRIRNNGHYEIGNIEWATPTKQRANTRLSRNALGVRFNPKCTNRPWGACTEKKGKCIYLGRFKTKEEAHKAYLKGREELNNGS